MGPSHGPPASLFSLTLLVFLVGVPQVLSLALLLLILYLSLGRLPQLSSEPQACFFPLATLQAFPANPLPVVPTELLVLDSLSQGQPH